MYLLYYRLEFTMLDPLKLCVKKRKTSSAMGSTLVCRYCRYTIYRYLDISIDMSLTTPRSSSLAAFCRQVTQETAEEVSSLAATWIVDM